MKTLSVALCLTLAGITAHAQNLLTNASYEEAGSSPDTAKGWSRWGDWMNREDSWSPTHAGQCMIGYHHWQITGSQNSGMWQDVAGVKAGQKFKFTVFVTADKPENMNPADKIELRLETIRNGKEVAINSASTAVTDLQQTPGWHELSVSGTTPDANIRALVVVTPAASAPRGGAVKIDDAHLELVK